MKPGSALRWCISVAVSSSVLMTGCRAFSAPLEHAHASPSGLARAVLDALEQSDLDALRGLALNEQEFREQVWPELPAARPERNLPFSYVWGDLRQKSELMLQGMLATHGGQHYELVEVRFLDKTTPYESYLVHRESELTVKDAAGSQRQLRVFGSAIEKNGRFKVFSYVTED